MRWMLTAALGLAVATGGAAEAQTWARYGGDSAHGRGLRSYDFHGQADRPGDFRCDAYWDRGRDDCDARWRDQRPFVSTYARRAYAPDYRSRGYGHAAGASAYHGAYGRPDLVYPAGGHDGGAASGRDPRRIGWCRANFRSYDPRSGYYRAYSGRLIYCG